MNILVTGAGGYLGSILTRMLLADGHYVTAIDTFEYGPSLAALVWNKMLTIVRGDLLDTRLLKSLVINSEFDVCIHLAAIVGADACDARFLDALQINEGLCTVIALGLPATTRLLYPCSNSGYGIGGRDECTEASPLNPLSHYGITKVRGEGVIMERSNSVSLRLATLFGFSPRMRRDLLVNDMVWRAVRDRSVLVFEGHFRRNFCHVRDAAAAFIHVLENWDTMKDQIYNVGDTAANMTKLQLCERIQKYVPAFRFAIDEHATDPDKRDYIVSNAKIEATGWKPTHSIDDGIEELIRGYKMLRREQYGNA